MKLEKHGIWFHTDGLSSAEAARLVHKVEELGFGSVWFGEGFGRDPLVHAAFLLSTPSRRNNAPASAASVFA